MIIISVVGTRPNFIKEYLIHRELKKRGIGEILVHTGQHYDYEMSKVFFEDFDLPKPDYYLNDNIASNVKHTALIMNFVEGVFEQENPDAILVYGDVNSTLASSIAAAKMDIPVIHVEGGVRSNKLYNPEEINRRVTDSISKLIFASTQTDYNNLVKENYNKSRISFVGDLMKDSLLNAMHVNSIKAERGDYLVCTIHRQENVESKIRLENILNALIESDRKIVFPVHPRTLKKVKAYGLSKMVSDTNIEIVESKGYIDFINLLAGANKVLTDSGGVRREAYILAKPLILLIDLIWFPEIHKAGWAYIADDQQDRIISGIRDFEPPAGKRPSIFGDGDAHKKIADGIELFLQNEKI
jgi:UDP-N-acetylglucosamine 2-epimerase